MKPKFKIVISFALLALVLFAAVPKLYTHSLSGPAYNAIHPVTENNPVSGQEEEKNCNFEKFDAPVYYTVFKFILNFLPLKETKQSHFFYKQDSIQRDRHSVFPLKDPAMA